MSNNSESQLARRTGDLEESRQALVQFQTSGERHSFQSRAKDWGQLKEDLTNRGVTFNEDKHIVQIKDLSDSGSIPFEVTNLPSTILPTGNIAALISPNESDMGSD